MPRVQLLYFPGCPHLGAARTQLRRAFEAVSIPASWTEQDVTLPDAPVELRGYGSPTILVNGRDVMGAAPADGAACRLYLGTDLAGAPPLQSLVSALTAR